LARWKAADDERADARRRIVEPTTPLITYTFVANSETVNSQIVAEGDTLNEPEAPVVAGHEVCRLVSRRTIRSLPPFGVQGVIAATTSITLTAHYETAYYVFFHNQYGSIIETRTPDSLNWFSTADITALELASNEALVGWATTSGGTTDVGASVTVDARISTLSNRAAGRLDYV
jgi:hypothetical protein